MIRTRFENIEFIEFIHTLRDLNLSLSEWGAKDPKNIWDLEVGIGENIYIIYVEIQINESND
tara:strand:+ start:211 stop:396 length:186 start_codon:yes stop_codon:yes gene_type:complete